jgi:hypothetical protein
MRGERKRGKIGKRSEVERKKCAVMRTYRRFAKLSTRAAMERCSTRSLSETTRASKSPRAVRNTGAPIAELAVPTPLA